MNWMSVRRGDPEVAYMEVQNQHLVSAGTQTSLVDGEPAFMLLGASGNGILVEGGDGDTANTSRQVLLGVIANNKGGVIPYGEYGNCQCWGYHGAVLKATAAAGSDWTAAGFVVYVADNENVVRAELEAEYDDANATQATGAVLGHTLAIVLAATTTGAVFIKKLGM